MTHADADSNFSNRRANALYRKETVLISNNVTGAPHVRASPFLFVPRFTTADCAFFCNLACKELPGARNGLEKPCVLV